MRTQIGLLVENYIKCVEGAQEKSGLISKELERFAESKGYVVKSPKLAQIGYQYKEALIDMLDSIALATKKTVKNKQAYIENLLIASLYFLEIDYDSPQLRKQEMEALLLSEDKLRSTDRRKWMSFRRNSVNDFGYKDDRRDLHGILVLQKLLEHGLKSKHNQKFSPFLADNLKLDQNKDHSKLKLHPRLIIAHLMFFWLQNESRSEEAIRKIISSYWNDKKKRKQIYLPNHYPLIFSELELWEKIHQIEKGNTISNIAINNIPLEWLIVHFWRSSLINKIQNLDEKLLIEFIRQKFQINLATPPEEILFWFQNNIDMRNS